VIRLARVIAGGTALALAVGAAIVAWEQLPATLQTPKVSAPEGSADYGQVPNFSLVERSGLLQDREGTSPRPFGLSGYPSTLLIDRNGRVVGLVRGERDWRSETVMGLIRGLLDSR
jgi:hypothetical protein